MSHMSRTMTILKGSWIVSEAIGEILPATALFRMCCCHSRGSEADPVITIFMNPLHRPLVPAQWAVA